MRLFNRLKEVFSYKQATAGRETVHNQDNLIKMYDKYGRGLLITKEEWRKNVLPNNIKLSWNNPEDLYQYIVIALRDEHFPDVLKASERLLDIDKNKERGYIIRGIVLMKNKKLKNAKEILQSYIDKYGKTGNVLTNLAKVYAEEGDQLKAEQILWEGLQLDPNQDNGLEWWLAIHNEKGGSSAYLSELKKVAGLNGSWRAHLWLAGEALKEKDLAAAKQYYDHVIAKAKDIPEVLMTISGDLGKAGYYDEVFSLVLPIYEPEKHDAYAGLNILQAYLESKKFNEGKQFLKRMFSLNKPDIRDNLMFYSNKFDESIDEFPRKIEGEQKIHAETMPLDKPIFYYGLKGAEWLLPEVVRDGPKISFMPLADLSAREGSAIVIEREDEVGRLTRSIPLYVSENLFFETNSYIQVLIPVATDGGMITTGKEYDVDYFLNTVKMDKEKHKFDYYIAGTISKVNNSFNIVLSIWDCESRQKIKSISQKSATQDDIGKAVKKLAHELQVFMEGKKRFLKVKPINYYKSLEDRLIGIQLLAYGQAFVLLAVVSNKCRNKDIIWGERGILRNPLDLALESPNNLIFKMLFISNLAKAHAYHSEVLGEFKQYAVDLVNDSKENEYIEKLSPLVYKLFGMDKEFHEFEDNLAKYPEHYRNWFKKLKESQ